MLKALFEHDQDVMQMNAICLMGSGWVQVAPAMVLSTITKPGNPDRQSPWS
jgi:hypothetical protein